MNGGNRSVTDRLDTALYDKIKQYQKLFAETIRVNIFNEILLEGGFDPITNPTREGMSDRCYFKFNEIDVDTQVKKETHIIQKYVNNVIGLGEARTELGIDPEYEIEDFFASLQADIQMDIANNQMQAAAQAKSTDVKKDADKQEPATNGQRNLPNRRRGAGNTIRPANQQGRNDSPAIRRSDSDFISLIENVLEKDYNIVYVKEEESDK